jgi:hypothetical protein
MKRFLFIIVTGVISLSILVFFGDSFCTKNKPLANAQILIIEGWLPANQLEEISRIFSFNDYKDVIVTGNDFSADRTGTKVKTYTTNGPVFLGNGAIILKDELKPVILNNDTIKTIKVYAKGTICKGINAHFTLFLNNKIIGDAFTESRSQEFRFDIINMPDSISMFVLNFDNDIKTENEDRNLVVDSIFFGNLKLTRKDFNLVRNDYPERYGFGFTSNAERAYYYLQSLEPCKNLYFISAPALQRNFTKYSARACNGWLQKKYPEQNLTVNIISADFHSARSYYTYKKELKEHRVGIISLKNHSGIKVNRIHNFSRAKRILEEYTGIVMAFL